VPDKWYKRTHFVQDELVTSEQAMRRKITPEAVPAKAAPETAIGRAFFQDQSLNTMFLEKSRGA
jgi:hypothetical protein